MELADPALTAIRRHHLSPSAWIDRATGWVVGQQALFSELRDGLSWWTHERTMYDGNVWVPRLMASLPSDGLHPMLARMQGALTARYGEHFDRVSFALYRDGADSVAWHRDRGLRERADSVMALVSLGGPRPFCMRPHRRVGSASSRRRSVMWSCGWGDLLVMGGSAHQDWEHGVPKVRHAEPRICVMFRPSYTVPPRPV
jgi:alkylated DNA repair dioxygenase AlkB